MERMNNCPLYLDSSVGSKGHSPSNGSVAFVPDLYALELCIVKLFVPSVPAGLPFKRKHDPFLRITTHVNS